VLGARAVGIQHNAMVRAQSWAARAEMLVDSAGRVRAGGGLGTTGGEGV